MPTIKTTVDETVYAKLVDMRRKRGLPSVSALFLNELGLLTDKTAAAEIVKSAISRAHRKRKGQTYRLKDLFPADRWEGFSKSSRLSAGKMFNVKINAPDSGIIALEKSSSNHQLYQTV